MVRKSSNLKIGIVFSGGGTRGFAHIGVLKVLEELNIKPSAIAGCSMGSAIGAMYASGKKASEIEEFVTKYNFSDVLDFKLTKLGIGSANKMKDMFQRFTGVKKFEQLKIPFFVTTTNITQGNERIFSSGELFPAIRASMAVPGLFAPVKIDESYYVDGGVLNHAPASILPEEIDRFVVIDTQSKVKHEFESKKLGILNIMHICIKIMQDQLTKQSISKLDPQTVSYIKIDLTDYGFMENKKNFKHIIDKGELAARRQINNIKSILNIE